MEFLSPSVSFLSSIQKGGENTEESSFRWGMNPILFSATLSGRFVRDSKVGDAFEPRKMATERARWSLGKRAQRAQRAQKGRGRERERDLACAFIFLVSFSSPRYGRIGVKISLSSLFFGPFFSLVKIFSFFFALSRCKNTHVSFFFFFFFFFLNVTDANDEKIEGPNCRHRQGGRKG